MMMVRRGFLLSGAAALCLLSSGCDTPQQAAAQATQKNPVQATSGPVTLGPDSAKIDLSAAPPLPKAPAPKPEDTGPVGLGYGPVSSDDPDSDKPPMSRIDPVKPAMLETAPASAAPPPDINSRVGRLEAQVADLHNTLDMMMPALTRLSLAQQNLQTVIEKIENDRAAAPSVATPVKAKPAKPVRKPAGPVAANLAHAPGHTNLAHPPARKPARAATMALPETLTAASPAPADAGTDKARAVIAGIAAGKEDNEDTGATHQPVDLNDAVTSPSAEAAGPLPKNVDVALTPSAAPAASANAAYNVDQIRFGEHGNMTRLVLDLSGKAPFSYHLDASGMLMTVRLPQTGWKTGASSVASNSRTVASYTATPDGQGGYVLAVKFKRPVTVSWSDTLPPSGDGGYRAVVDLTPKG